MFDVSSFVNVLTASVLRDLGASLVPWVTVSGWSSLREKGICIIRDFVLKRAYVLNLLNGSYFFSKFQQSEQYDWSKMSKMWGMRKMVAI